MLEYLQRMARYNQWMNQNYIEADLSFFF